MLCRAKFVCTEALHSQYGPRRYKFSAVATSETPENERFHTATPSASLEMFVDNPNVVFVPGTNYYLDFTESAS